MSILKGTGLVVDGDVAGLAHGLALLGGRRDNRCGSPPMVRSLSGLHEETLVGETGNGDQGGEEDAKAARLSPRLIGSLRRRLGVSQMALARLVGVSAPAVTHWMAGDSMPTGKNRMTLVALRRVGKREVKELLARRVKETASRRRRTRKRPARRPRKRLKR